MIKPLTMPVFNKEELPKHLKSYTKSCAWCSTTFYTTKPKTKYCRSTCRVYAFQKRNPELVAQEKQPTKKDLRTVIEKQEKILNRSISFDKLKEYQKYLKKIEIIKSHLLARNPEIEVSDDQKLLLTILENIDYSDQFLNKIAKNITDNH